MPSTVLSRIVLRVDAVLECLGSAQEWVRSAVQELRQKKEEDKKQKQELEEE